MQASPIEWTDVTWNPVRGCVKISPGCANCYAFTFAERWRGVPGHAYERGFDPREAPDQLDAPLHWKKPRKIFVNSMSDLFFNGFNVVYVGAVCEIMRVADQHTYQVLTKRASRMRALLRGELRQYAGLRNVWWGVSVEDRKHGVPRIAHLQDVDAAVRILSVEPLLEDLGELDLSGIHQVIVGGESGHGARPMQPEWVRSIRDQCVAADVPFFFKQWGAWAPAPLGGRLLRVGKKAAGRELDGRVWSEFPRT